MESRSARALERLLDEERTELMAGRLGTADRDGTSRIALMTLIAREGASPEEMTRIRQKAEMNGRLMRAMASGIKSVIERLAAADKTAVTYDPSGRRTSLPTGDSRRGTRA